MKFIPFVMLFLFACQVQEDMPTPTRSATSKGIDVAACQCSVEWVENGNFCLYNNDTDYDCVCDNEDICNGPPNCDQANADGDAFGDVCDIMPNTADPEAVIAAMDARLDALESAGTGAAITALQADVALLTAALVEVRSKYPAHFHGLLGLNGDPVGSSGDLSYELPGDP